MRGLLAVSRRLKTGAAALAGYCLISFAYLGLGPLLEGGHRYLGQAYDPQIFIWSFAWWPHAILNGENPFFTHAVWSPVGVNAMWATTVPGLALLFAPLTLLAGPFVSYDLASVLAPALAAWTAFLLCRRLTGSFGPSLLGGYLFGFSGYVLAQSGAGNLDLSSVALLPLLALLVLRFLDGELAARGLVLSVGPLLALQLLFSTEVVLTASLALAVAFALGFALAPARRSRLRALIVPLVGAYLLAGLLTAPFLYYVLSGIPAGRFYDPNRTGADLANFVIPPRLLAVGGSWFGGISRQFQGEGDAYLGLPVLVIVALYARTRFKSPGGRFLLAALTVAVVATLGGRATVDGRASVSLPWALVDNLPLVGDVQEGRLAVYVSLLVAVVAALWAATRSAGLLRWLLPLLAVVAILPEPGGGRFATAYHVPAFFTAHAYRSCLDPGETVLAFPVRGGPTLLWQVESDFRFNLAGGDIGPDIPQVFFEPDPAIAGGSPLGPGETASVQAFVQAFHVTSILVDGSDSSLWTGALDPIAPHEALGGVVVYHLAPNPPSCLGA